MKVLLNELVEQRDKLTQEKKKLVAKGYFRIRSVNGTCNLKLKGQFNGKNRKVIHQAMSMSGASRRKCIELDMSEVDTIDMQAMALLTISLKTLKENGMYTKVTGLDAEIRKMAFELGMHCIAQIH